MSISDRSEFR